jgi:hypothetical protein
MLTRLIIRLSMLLGRARRRRTRHRSSSRPATVYPIDKADFAAFRDAAIARAIRR